MKPAPASLQAKRKMEADTAGARRPAGSPRKRQHIRGVRFCKSMSSVWREL